MINRFRIEATGKTHKDVEKELLKSVGAVAKAIREETGQLGHWHVTDDVIHLEKPVSYPQREPDKQTYKGRIVMAYRGFTDA